MKHERETLEAVIAARNHRGSARRKAAAANPGGRFNAMKGPGGGRGGRSDRRAGRGCWSVIRGSTPT
jgi:hypothetical protein